MIRLSRWVSWLVQLRHDLQCVRRDTLKRNRVLRRCQVFMSWSWCSETVTYLVCLGCCWREVTRWYLNRNKNARNKFDISDGWNNNFSLHVTDLLPAVGFRSWFSLARYPLNKLPAGLSPCPQSIGIGLYLNLWRMIPLRAWRQVWRPNLVLIW